MCSSKLLNDCKLMPDGPIESQARPFSVLSTIKSWTVIDLLSEGQKLLIAAQWDLRLRWEAHDAIITSGVCYLNYDIVGPDFDFAFATLFFIHTAQWEEKEIILTSNSCLWPRPSSAFGPWQPRNKIKCGFDLEIYRPIGPQQKRLRQHWHFREMRPLPLGYLNA